LSKTLFLKEKKRKGILEFEIKTEGVLVSEKLVSAIVWYCSRAHDKNLALSYFSSFINAVGRRKGIYYMLSKNERLVEILAKLFGVSRLAANYLINHPESIDTIFLASQISPDLPDEVEFWESIKSGDVDSILDELRKMKKEKILLLLLDDVSKSLSHDEISERICRIYDFFLRQTLSLTAREKLKINLPPPHLNIPFYIIALGKYGSKEAIYGSDVDLVFVFSEPDPEKWIRFSQKFIVFLTASTKEGYGLQVDMRLRPSGHAGPLALSFDAFWEFYLNKADIWQRLSLLKSRVVFGGDKKHEFGYLLNEIKKLAFENIDLESIISAMRDLRRKSLEKLSFKFENGKKLINLKYCLGGMQDVEFITFFVLLKERKFELDFKQGVIFASYFFPKIKSAYDVLRKIEKYLKIRSDIPLEDIWIQEDDGVFWDELKDFSGVSYKDFLEAKKAIASAFKEIFGEV
jgi:glutamate-ammonia-ligase adenylyltransferase